MSRFYQKYLVQPGTSVHLRDYDPDDHGGYDKEHAVQETDALQERMQSLQEKLYASARRSLLIVLQAMDTGGKDGAIRKVFQGINPQGVRVAAFKAPTPEELSHDFLWRIHPHVPPKGCIGIFNRSHYEDVLIVRVNELAPRSVWERRYDHINAFERLLADSGTCILKFYLHISKDEQKQRLLDRLHDPAKQWKFSTGDLPVRARWDDYMRAYEDVFTRCSTEAAPWLVVPANRKWYRDLIIAQAVVAALDDMKLTYPDPEPGLEGIAIPD